MHLNALAHFVVRRTPGVVPDFLYLQELGILFFSYVIVHQLAIWTLSQTKQAI